MPSAIYGSVFAWRKSIPAFCWSRRYALLPTPFSPQCIFSPYEWRYEFPDESVPAGETVTTYLRKLVERGLRWRYAGGLPPWRFADPVACGKMHPGVDESGMGARQDSVEDAFGED